MKRKLWNKVPVWLAALIVAFLVVSVAAAAFLTQYWISVQTQASGQALVNVVTDWTCSRTAGTVGTASAVPDGSGNLSVSFDGYDDDSVFRCTTEQEAADENPNGQTYNIACDAAGLASENVTVLFIDGCGESGINEGLGQNIIIDFDFSPAQPYDSFDIAQAVSVSWDIDP